MKRAAKFFKFPLDALKIRQNDRKMKDSRWKQDRYDAYFHTCDHKIAITG